MHEDAHKGILSSLSIEDLVIDKGVIHSLAILYITQKLKSKVFHIKSEGLKIHVKVLEKEFQVHFTFDVEIDESLKQAFMISLGFFNSDYILPPPYEKI